MHVITSMTLTAVLMSCLSFAEVFNVSLLPCVAMLMRVIQYIHIYSSACGSLYLVCEAQDGSRVSVEVFPLSVPVLVSVTVQDGIY